MPFYYSKTRSRRAEAFLDGQGLVAEPFARGLCPHSNAPGSGRVIFTAVPILAGSVLTNIHVVVTEAGATLTLVKLGVYKKDGTRVAVTADAKASFGTTGLKTVALTTPYTVPDDGLYYLAILATGTTAPKYLGMTALAVTAAIGSGAIPNGDQTGQTDLPASATIAASLQACWLGAS